MSDAPNPMELLELAGIIETAPPGITGLPPTPHDIARAVLAAGWLHHDHLPYLNCKCGRAYYLPDITQLWAELDNLRRWKAEALTVMEGLQRLGRILDLPLGEQITGHAAADAAQRLVDQNAALHAANAEWATKHGEDR